ncbi:DUF2550 domain-containing protein [Aeromicrobium sp. Leaf350]|uniref:DUF2550 domain-containing protein n=1 Tax=Aeromicrobium sp. Leaf350 TaxID=2876565 RepID=UPI001E5276B7|nr:DUF2550 domain-containing protein [Aeromicrobium sp. Leaf350]
MPLWLWLVDSLLAVVVLAIVLLALVVVRRRSIERRSGAFELTVSRRDSGAAGWSIGTGVYHDDHLEWYRTFSLAWRPTIVLPRRGVEISGRRQPDGAEGHVLSPGYVVVDLQASEGQFRLALTPPALTGLLAWLESSPPGRGINTVL